MDPMVAENAGTVLPPAIFATLRFRNGPPNEVRLSEIDPELALRFLDEVYEGIRKAREMPLLFRVVETPYRRVLCDTFPYRIMFEVIKEMQAVHIVSAFHQMRHPDRWKERLE
jgi:plasmid stabilization system protein ParE